MVKDSDHETKETKPEWFEEVPMIMNVKYKSHLWVSEAEESQLETCRGDFFYNISIFLVHHTDNITGITQRLCSIIRGSNPIADKFASLNTCGLPAKPKFVTATYRLNRHDAIHGWWSTCGFRIINWWNCGQLAPVSSQSWWSSIHRINRWFHRQTGHQ